MPNLRAFETQVDSISVEISPKECFHFYVEDIRSETNNFQEFHSMNQETDLIEKRIDFLFNY